MSSQLALPVPLNPDEVTRKKSLGAAIELCAAVGGFDLDKELQLRLGVDKAQFSRWQSGSEGVVWPKFTRLMDECGLVSFDEMRLPSAPVQQRHEFVVRNARENAQLRDLPTVEMQDR